MSLAFPELDQIRQTVDETTRTRHLAAVSVALRERHQGFWGRGRALALALVLVLLLPVMALAAEDSVPGDFLYPLKRAVEPVVQVFDSDVPAERRVREVEVLFERDAPDDVIVRHVDVARSTVTDRHQSLSDRIDRVVHQLDVRRGDRERDANPDAVAPDKPGDSPQVDRPADQVPVVPADGTGNEADEEDNDATTTSTLGATGNTAAGGDRRGDG